LITADAVKRRLSALAFESAVIAPIIVKPQAEKNCRHQQTVKNGGAGEIKHALELGRGAAGGARISMKLSSGANALFECRTDCILASPLRKIKNAPTVTSAR
jgi:hypothetical protein